MIVPSFEVSNLNYVSGKLHSSLGQKNIFTPIVRVREEIDTWKVIYTLIRLCYSHKVLNARANVCPINIPGI